MKPPQSSLAKELDAQVAAALDDAHGMPPGDQRTKAMNKATTLRNAAEMHGHLSRKGGAPPR